MAVTTTPRDILTGAYAKSTKNKPGTLATEATELLQVVIRAMRGLYLVGSRVNPTFFAVSADVTLAAGCWARPQAAQTLFRVERTGATTGGTGAAGDEVAVVPFDDRTAEEGMGAVYELGQQFYAAGNALDPTGGDLRFWYSKRPSDPADLDTAVDALWTEDHNELLMDEVAIYLALKDGRMDEVGVLRPERDREAKLFIAFLESATPIVRHRHSEIRRFITNSLVPLESLLAGGANLQAA